MAEKESNSPQKRTVQYRIDDADASSIIVMAILFDLISVVPIANDVSVFIAQPILYLAFRLRNVDPLGRRNWVWFLAGWIVELIPGISILPMIVIESLRWIAISRIEDKIKSKGLAVEGEKTKALARRFLQQKQVQLAAKKAERGSARDAARKEDGSLDKDKYKEKRGQIADRKSDLDKALAPDANSGVRSSNGNSKISRTRTERKLSPEEAANADPSRQTRTERQEIIDYGNKSPEERAAANANNVEGPAPYQDAA